MLQNIEIKSFCTPPLSLSLIKTVKETSAECLSFLDGVVIFLKIGCNFHPPLLTQQSFKGSALASLWCGTFCPHVCVYLCFIKKKLTINDVTWWSFCSALSHTWNRVMEGAAIRLKELFDRRVLPNKTLFGGTGQSEVNRIFSSRVIRIF